MIIKVRKQNHTRYSIKPQRPEKARKTKTGARNKGIKQKTELW